MCFSFLNWWRCLHAQILLLLELEVLSCIYSNVWANMFQEELVELVILVGSEEGVLTSQPGCQLATLFIYIKSSCVKLENQQLLITN